MERDLSLKTNWLVTKKAYDITIIAARQVKGNSYFQLPPKIKLVDLAVDFSKKRIFLFKNEVKKDWKNKLSKYLSQNDFDIIVTYCGMDFHFFTLFRIKK